MVATKFKNFLKQHYDSVVFEPEQTRNLEERAALWCWSQS